MLSEIYEFIVDDIGIEKQLGWGGGEGAEPPPPLGVEQATRSILASHKRVY